MPRIHLVKSQLLQNQEGTNVIWLSYMDQYGFSLLWLLNLSFWDIWLIPCKPLPKEKVMLKWLIFWLRRQLIKVWKESWRLCSSLVASTSVFHLLHISCSNQNRHSRSLSPNSLECLLTLSSCLFHLRFWSLPFSSIVDSNISLFSVFGWCICSISTRNFTIFARSTLTLTVTNKWHGFLLDQVSYICGHIKATFYKCEQIRN